MKKKVVALIQARLGSTRLPYKMLLSLHGHPIIEWVVRRVKQARLLDEVVAAIPNSDENDILDKCIRNFSIPIFRGSEDDVLGRFFQAAKAHAATHIVRICADNPLVSGEEIDNLIKFYNENPCDYAYNHIPCGNSYPDGLGAEIVSFELLASLEKKTVDRRHRVHCFSYIIDHPSQYKIMTFDPPNPSVSCSKLKLDLDTYSDFQYLAKADFDINIGCEEIIQIFKKIK